MNMAEQNDDLHSIRSIVSENLYADSRKRTKRVRDQNIDFAHYTSSSNAFDIIRGRCFWLRNSQLMSDYTEMKLGLRAIQLGFFKTHSAGDSFWRAMREIDPDLEEKINREFERLFVKTLSQTWVGCLSEFSTNVAGQYQGRLSMWRAYGYPNGAALIFNSKVLTDEQQALDVSTNPVFYTPYGVVLPELNDAISRLADNAGSLSQFDPDLIAKVIAETKANLATGIKDSNFHEEKEWRVVYREGVFPFEYSVTEAHVISGVPQLVRVVPLDDNDALSMKDILKKVIVGPTEHPESVRDAFVSLLSAEGFDSPELMVEISDIPFRD